MQNELNRTKNGSNPEFPEKKLLLLKVLMPEHFRTQICNSKTLHENVASGDGGGIRADYNKYCDKFDARFHGSKSIFMVQAPTKNSNILDISAGMGFYRYICKQNGHKVNSFDMHGVRMFLINHVKF